jgi:hypothetical protein
MMDDEDRQASRDPTSATVPDASGRRTTLPAPEVREAAIQLLSTAFAQDYLSTEEFERRVTEVYRAASESAVAAVTADLPAATESTQVVPARAMSAKLSSVLSNVERGGSLVVPAELRLQSTMGNIVLDLRQARFQEGVTEIRVRAIMGNIELLLPEDLQVECRGRALVGHFAHRATGVLPDRGQRPDRVVVLTGWSILGSVEARHVSSASDDPGPTRSLPSGSVPE